MSVQCTSMLGRLFSPITPDECKASHRRGREHMTVVPVFRKEEGRLCIVLSNFVARLSPLGCNVTRWRSRCSRNGDRVNDGDDGMIDEEERLRFRKQIRETVDEYRDVQREPQVLDPEEMKRLEKLFADCPLIVDEEDPDWPEDGDNGWGFGLDQFFNKISIKDVKKEDDDDDDDSDKEIEWEDDDYIRAIKDISSAIWDETVFKDISPLVVLVHNRYRRPEKNEQCRKELEKAVNIIWDCGFPSPRCVAIDAVTDTGLASALKVAVFPEMIFTKAGKILYREKGIRPAEELSKIMAYFYFGASKPSYLTIPDNSVEMIPSAPRKH